MKRAEAFPSKYFNVKGLRLFPNAERIWTIRDVRKEGVESQDGVVTDKNIMYFTEDESTPLIVNPTNWDILEEAWGDESDAWVGKKIQLYVDPNVRNPSGGPPGGVRFKIPAGSPVRAAPRPSAPAASTPPAGKVVKLDDLLAEAVLAGLVKEDVITMLHTEGYTLFNADTTVPITALVRAFIADHTAKKPSTDEKPARDAAGEECPF